MTTLNIPHYKTLKNLPWVFYTVHTYEFLYRFQEYSVQRQPHHWKRAKWKIVDERNWGENCSAEYQVTNSHTKKIIFFPFYQAQKLIFTLLG